jgi:hypothetical protein
MVDLDEALEVLARWAEAESVMRVRELEALFRRFDAADGEKGGKLHYNEFLGLLGVVNDRITAGPQRAGTPDPNADRSERVSLFGAPAPLPYDPDAARPVKEGAAMFALYKDLHKTSPSGGDFLVDPEAFAVTLFRAGHFAVMPDVDQT